MSKGKYSPTVYSRNDKDEQFDKNCYGQSCVEWSQAVADSGVVYNEKLMFPNYDSQGFDSYGYSAFDNDGEYVGVGYGVDRRGYTESQYQAMSDDEYEDSY